jgi:hypothetical protein
MEIDHMTRVLFVQQPETVDFTDPAIPPGFNAEKIHAGIEIAMASPSYFELWIRVARHA